MTSDEQTLREMDERNLEEACRLFLRAEQRFQKLSEHPDKVSDPRINVMWWSALETVYELEKTVWKLFVGEKPTMADNKLSARFRKTLLEGSKLKADS